MSCCRRQQTSNLPRRKTPARKEIQTNGRVFMLRKQQRHVRESVRRLCHEAIREIGPDPEKVETAVASRVRSRIPEERCKAYLKALPGVLRRILAAKRY